MIAHKRDKGRSISTAWAVSVDGVFAEMQRGAPTLADCRITLSVRISKWSNCTSCFCKIFTTRELKPQRGASGEPFMSSMMAC